MHPKKKLKHYQKKKGGFKSFFSCVNLTNFALGKIHQILICHKIGKGEEKKRENSLLG